MRVRVTLTMLMVTLGLGVAGIVACRQAPRDVTGFRPATVAAPRQAARATPTPPGDLAAVQEILSRSCAVARCHNAESLAGRLSLAPAHSRGNLVGVKASQMPTGKLVVPGEPQHSYLLAKLRGDKGIKGSRMPMGRDLLAPEEMQTIEQWIASGARE